MKHFSFARACAVSLALCAAVFAYPAKAAEPEKPRRIGFMTGTFDPVHNGHLAMMQLAVDKLHLDKLFVSPNVAPGHKSNATSIVHRKKMLLLALKSNPKIELLPNDMADLIPTSGINAAEDALIKRYGKNALYYQIAGTDSFNAFMQKLKKSGKQLKTSFRFVIITRTGYACAVPDEFKDMVIVISEETKHQSSTEIRKAVSARNFSGLDLPGPVLDYIKTNKLYSGSAIQSPAAKP